MQQRVSAFSDSCNMDSTAEQRLEDRLEKGLEGLHEALVRIEQKLDAQHDRLEERVRVLEQRMAQVWVLGALATFIVGPVLALVVGKMVH